MDPVMNGNLVDESTIERLRSALNLLNCCRRSRRVGFQRDLSSNLDVRQPSPDFSSFVYFAFVTG